MHTKRKLKLSSQKKSTSRNAAMRDRSARGDQLTAHLIGNSTSLSILSRHRAFLKEKRLSWMTRVWGSLHTDICLLASRCSLQLGQYLQTPPHAQATVPGMHTEACRHHLTLRQQFKVCAQGYAVFMLAHMHTPPLSLSHRHLLTGLSLLLTAGAVPADITPCSGNSSRYAHRGKLFARSCTHARTQAHTHTHHIYSYTHHTHTYPHHTHRTANPPLD